MSDRITPLISLPPLKKIPLVVCGYGKVRKEVGFIFKYDDSKLKTTKCLSVMKYSQLSAKFVISN